MARGWESKSVESQIEAADGNDETRRKTVSQATLSPAQIERERERESVEMSRKRVLHDLETATHARYRQQLEAALRFLDNRLKELRD